MRARLLSEVGDVVAAVNKWWITIAVMLSLLLQLLLLLTGGTRKWNLGFRFGAWLAYNWSDYVATSALGSLAQAAAGDNAGGRKEVYALWAPFLLLHLGAPDNISAYSLADAELWLRHGLTMVLQVSVAIYVVVTCARGWKFILLSVCLTTLGGIKYAERTFALKQASRDSITKSSLPIYKYMLAEAHMHLEVKGAVLSQDGGRQITNDSAAPSYYYIIDGDEQWHLNFLRGGDSSLIQDYTNAAQATTGLVTLQDILSSRDLTTQTPSTVLICVGFALFKLYKRRLCSLFLYEWRAEKTRQFFLDEHVFADEEQLMFAVDVELRFLFDALYTKAAGTAFSKPGVIFRIVTTSLLVISAVFILGGRIDLHDQASGQARDITFCLISAALIIESNQLLRLVLSDWCRVWLARKYILVGEKMRNRSTEGKALRCSKGYRWRASLLLMFMKLSSRVGRHKYWTSRIGQYALINPGDANARSTTSAKVVGWFRRELLPEYVHSKQVVDEFKKYVLRKVIVACREVGGSKVTDLTWFLRRYQDTHRSILQDTLFPDGYFDFEHVVVSWHVATCALELLLPASEIPSMEEQNEDAISSSKLLSRYLMYLMVHKPELLPCHAEIARQLALDSQKQVQNSDIVWDGEHVSGLLRGPEASIEQLPSNLRGGFQAARRLLLGLDPAEQWPLIASVWVDILMTAAACNKPVEQLQQLTHGGELLTHLWVLLGHIGCGSQ